MFDQDGLGDYRTDSAGPQEPGEGGDNMDQKDDEIEHPRIIAKPGFD